MQGNIRIRRREDPEFRAAWKASLYSRRTLRKENPIIEEEVFIRDGWICQLCADPVDPDDKHPSKWSPSLDHIIPLSRGGTHTWDNVQLAHLGCNSSKGGRDARKGSCTQRPQSAIDSLCLEAGESPDEVR
ncbi:HNH endonuclease [Gordonia phage SweatNTears]|nr:HNH endonuclease [Gordonia phage SweatNTears]